MVKRFLRKVRSFLLVPVLQSLQSRNTYIGRETQILMSLTYKQMLHSKAPLPSFDEIGFRAYSQNDEDGILLYIFSLIGTTNKKVIDIGCGGVQNSNTANLLINHGWIGLLIDGNEKAIQAAKEFYSNCPDTRQIPPALVHAFVTAENINQLIPEHGFGGEIDLLSIDLDGVDYWIWKAIDCITPRVLSLQTY